MQEKPIDELALSAAETPVPALLESLSAAVKRAAEISEKEHEALDLMFESWMDRIEKETPIGNFVLDVCSLMPVGSSTLRRALGAAVKAQLPPYLAKQGLQRALGLRERTVSPHQIVNRFRNLLALQPNMLCFLPESLSFAKVEAIDDLTGSVVLRSIPEATSYRVPLEIALSNFTFFESTAISRRLLTPSRKESITSTQWRQDASRFATSKLSDAELEVIARAVFVPLFMTAEAFNSWWKSEAAPVKSIGSIRTVGDARSLVELGVLLKECDPGTKLAENDIAKLVLFFNRQRLPATLKDVKLVAGVLCQLHEAVDREDFAVLLDGYKTRLPFFPMPETVPAYAALEVWGELPSKEIPRLLECAAALYGWEYWTAFARMLPLKALNALFTDVSFTPDMIRESVRSALTLSADMLVWIWKNRKADGAPYLDTLTMENVINGIVMLELPKAWGSAQRELKKMLIDDIALIKTIIDNAGDDVRTIIYAVQRAKGFNQGEQQSLLVKLSRHSDSLKAILEAGEGRKMMSAVSDGEDDKKVEPLITSLKSFRAKNAELENLINVLIPENRVAIEEARSHGDFRENAEYDAAKERRRFLSSHRAQLERDILNAQPIDFRTVNVEKHVIVGCTVSLADQSGKPFAYHVVGAFDSHPDANCVAYRTPIGDALMGHSAGDTVELPGHPGAKIVKVSALDEKILQLLAE